MDKQHQSYRAVSIDPNTIQVGATAKRNSDGSLLLNNTVHSQAPINAIPINELIQRTTTNILKQPHHKLPLKMLLSETARRGGGPINASLPVSTHHFKPIEDIFQVPPEMDWKKSRLELLTDPKHLTKKNYQSKRGIKHFQYTNPFNSSGSLFGSSFTTLDENPLPANEDSNFAKLPNCSSQILCNRSNNISIGSLKEQSASQVTVSKNNNPYSTPHTLEKFQNLYGSNFKQQITKIEIPAKSSMETHFNDADVTEPISEMHAWCREKSFVTTPDNTTPIPQSPYYTNTKHDSRSLNELVQTPMNADAYKENLQPLLYTSQNFIETAKVNRLLDYNEGDDGQALSTKIPHSRSGYTNRVLMNCDDGFDYGVGTNQALWHSNDRVYSSLQAHQAYSPVEDGEHSRSADISFTVRETEYSFSIDSQ